MKKLVELVIILAASMWPLFFFAKQINRDEFQKFGAGAATTAAAVYLMWRKKS